MPQMTWNKAFKKIIEENAIITKQSEEFGNSRKNSKFLLMKILGIIHLKSIESFDFYQHTLSWVSQLFFIIG